MIASLGLPTTFRPEGREHVGMTNSCCRNDLTALAAGKTAQHMYSKRDIRVHGERLIDGFDMTLCSMRNTLVI